MIIKDIYIKSYNWTVNIIYKFNKSDIKQIVELLDNIDCPFYLLQDCINFLKEDKLNTGVTYSNYKNKSSIIIIGKQIDKYELLNTIVHECYHLIQHINHNNNLSEEDCAILIGDLIKIILFKLNLSL